MSGSIVQSGYSVDDSGGSLTTIAVTITGVTAGNHLVAFAGWTDPGTTTCTVSDGSAFSTGAAKVNLAASNQSSQVFYRENVGSGSHTITATFSTSQPFRRLRVLEVSGLATASSLDQGTGAVQGAPGTGANGVSSTASSATTNANDFVLGFSQDITENDPGTGTVTAGTGFTISGSNIIMSVESKSVSATGAQTATFTQSVNNARSTHVVALKEAAAAAASMGSRLAQDPRLWTIRNIRARPTRSFASATSGEIAGTNGLTFSQVGALGGLGALAGTATVTFSQTGALAGTAALSGSAALTFAQSGAIGGLGTLAGSIALTFGQTGAFAGAGALAGSTTLTFTATATADAPSGAMVGTATMTFGQAAGLGGLGALAGTIALQFGQTGSAGGTGALGGAAAFTFAQTADLKGAAALVGTAPLTFDQSGNLTAQGGAIAGTATITFNLSGAADQPAGTGDGGASIIILRRRRRR